MARVMALLESWRIMGIPRYWSTNCSLAAAQTGASTSAVMLNALNIRGCQSCYMCKKTAYAPSGDMTPLYDEIAGADVVVFAAPVYMGFVTASSTC